MSEEYQTSPYEHNDYAGPANPLPYIEAPSQSSSVATTASTQQQFSRSRPSQLAAEYGMGKVLKEYKSEAPMLTTTGIPAAIGGTLLLIISAVILQEKLYVVTTSDGQWIYTSVRWVIIAGIALFVYGVPRTCIGIYKGVVDRIKNTQFYLCRNGVMHINARQVRVARWEQITAVQKSLAPGDVSRFARRSSRSRIAVPCSYTLVQLILYLDEGAPLVLDKGFLGFEGLGAKIEQEVRQRLLPQAIAGYEAGRKINFGAINVTPQGLSLEKGQQELPWEKLGGVEDSREEIIIKERETMSEWARIDGTEMLNLCVFIPFINHIWKSRRLKEIEIDEQKSLSHRVSTGDLAQQSEWQAYE